MVPAARHEAVWLMNRTRIGRGLRSRSRESFFACTLILDAVVTVLVFGIGYFMSRSYQSYRISSKQEVHLSSYILTWALPPCWSSRGPSQGLDPLLYHHHSAQFVHTISRSDLVVYGSGHGVIGPLLIELESLSSARLISTVLCTLIPAPFCGVGTGPIISFESLNGLRTLVTTPTGCTACARSWNESGSTDDAEDLGGECGDTPFLSCR